MQLGWGGWIRTNEMAESESAALPLGDAPTMSVILTSFVLESNYKIVCFGKLTSPDALRYSIVQKVIWV